jgi:hypothetical protein
VTAGTGTTAGVALTRQAERQACVAKYIILSNFVLILKSLLFYVIINFGSPPPIL